jgi:hypothetical protein
MSAIWLNTNAVGIARRRRRQCTHSSGKTVTAIIRVETAVIVGFNA